MPKSASERVKAYLVRKRRRAREAGLCYTCCKQKPDPGRTVCAACNVANIARQKRKRERDRKVAELHNVIKAHERRGDINVEHHLYDEAAQHYQQALRTRVVEPPDRIRLYEKLARVLYFSNNSKSADRWLEAALAEYTKGSGQGVKLGELLLTRANNTWADGEIERSLPDIARAIEIAKATCDERLYKNANLRMALYLRNLGRFDEADSFFRAIPGVDENDAPVVQAGFFNLRAIISARRGRAADAYADFDRVMKVALDKLAPESFVSLITDRGRWETALGDTPLAKASLERALLVARQNHIGWRVPFACILYADILTRMGSLLEARKYLREALSYETPTIVVKLFCAMIGITLSLWLKDDETLAQCSSPNILATALRGGVPSLICPVVAAFARLYAAQGRMRKSQELLHQALPILTYIDQSWEFCLEIARHGKPEDVPRARELLEERTHLPNARVVSAYLSLFDAFVAHNQSQNERTVKLAEEAVKRFEAIQWYGYANVARTLLPTMKHSQHAVPAHAPFAEAHAILTPRERQVAALVLNGFTNRAIADALSIKETTVESHMTSIMTRLGVRSRYQFSGVLDTV